MKLNFWQWIGVGLLVVGVLLYLFERTTPTANPPGSITNDAVTSSPTAPPTTMPTATPTH